MQAPGGLISRRRSLALDEAAAAEARRAEGIDDDDDEVIEVDSDDEKSRKKAEGVGSSLSAKFAAKGAKGAGRGKKKEEVGPSGQTYTPLEKQFMEIKGENPDVLLLMEGESGVDLGSSHSRLQVQVPRRRRQDCLQGARHCCVGPFSLLSDQTLIQSFPSRNFYTASIPVHRLNIHVKK